MRQGPNQVKSDLIFNERLTDFSVDICNTIVFGKDAEDDMQKDVVSMMSTLPLEYNESILVIAREFTRLNRSKK